MKHSPFTEDFIHFFVELASNNNKAWFDQNRTRYQTSVKEPFKIFIQTLLGTFGIETETKHCIFRINRDIRFSKDKTPYKLHCGAVLSEKGKKHHGGYYIECGPEFFKFYGGTYNVSKDHLYKIRTNIMKKHNLFETLISDYNFTSNFGSIHGDKNKIIPIEFKSFAQKQSLMMNKQFYFFKKLPARVILKDNIIDVCSKLELAARPLNLFFENAK